MNNTKKWRVLVGEFHQETNSFCPVNWTLDHFRQDTLLEGQSILAEYDDGSGRILSGIIAEAQAQGAQIVPGCAMRATSGGPVEQEVVSCYLTVMLDCLRTQGPFDALILSFHGATQSVQEDDVCGHILEELRKAAGPDVVMAIGCDLHANITQKIRRNADYICGFQTYPHVDQFQTGVRAARLAFRHLQGGKRLYRAAVTLPMIVPASGYSTLSGRFAQITDRAHQMTEEKKLVDFTLFQMQPWLDVNPAGSVVLTIGENAAQTKQCARELAQALYDSRQEFQTPLMSVQEIVSLARKAPEGWPVILVDFADSAGAGAMGDSAYVLSCLRRMDYPVKAAMVISDPAAVQQAFRLGAGGRDTFDLGGGLTPGTDAVHQVEAEVKSLHDGVFYQAGPVGAGQRRNLGDCAVLRVENVDVLVCQHICGAGDVEIYRSFGIQPTAYQLVAVKANTSFRAGYESFASRICLANTPGIATADLLSLHYTHLPENMYPFAPWDAGAVQEPEIW